MIKVTLKNHKTEESVETFYSIKDLVSHGGEDLLIENIIENNVCHCNPIGETNVVECDCWEQWEDCTLVIDEDYIQSLENLLIFMCQTYEETEQSLLKIAKEENNDAFMKVPKVQGTPNVIGISKLSKKRFLSP